MSYTPAYPSRINWENEPSTASPLNETNLNKMDYALYQHDQALQGQDSRISTLEDADKVTSFKGRTGAVVPANDDYTIAQIKATGTAGQVPTLNSQGKLEMADVPKSGHEIVNPSGTSMPQRRKLKVMGSVSVSDDSANDQTVINVTGGGGGGSGHTIQNPSGSSMTQRTNLQFKGTGVTVTDDASGDKTVVEIEGGSSSGHTIKDGDGTAMTAQPNLQFADAKVTNDAQGQATKVQNFVDINWDDWQEVDDNDDTYYRVTDAPLVDGNVEVDLMKKLWENPAPTASFVAQNITLDSADYDFLYIAFTAYDGNANAYESVTIPKGKGCILSLATGYRGSENIRTRQITYVSDTSLSVGDGYLGQASATVNNATCVPIVVYGIKQKVSISLSAIISNVSTSASKCMLSDGETSVEDVVTGYPHYTDVITTINTRGASYTTTKDGWLVGIIGCSENKQAWVKIDGVTVASMFVNSASVCPISYNICIPVKAGQIITTRSDSGNYDLTFYGKY
jgi:hypothetical protein